LSVEFESWYYLQLGDEKGLQFPHQGEKPYGHRPGKSRGPVFFAFKSISWGKAWIPALAAMTKSLAILSRFSNHRTLFYQPVTGELAPEGGKSNAR
jgi:hypothetical protein